MKDTYISNANIYQMQKGETVLSYMFGQIYKLMALFLILYFQFI